MWLWQKKWKKGNNKNEYEEICENKQLDTVLINDSEGFKTILKEYYTIKDIRNLLNHSGETEDHFVKDIVKTENENLQKLKNYVRDIISNWKKFGEECSVNSSNLSEISNNSQKIIGEK